VTGEIVHVAVAVITNNKDQVLISKRPDDVHLGGCWEFPGGKVEVDENVEDALRREIKEELDINIQQSRPLIQITHHYKDKSVLLDVWKITQYSGDAIGNEGQSIDWKAPSDLIANNFPEADIPIIQAIQLPECCLITGDFESGDDFMCRLEAAINKGIKLVQCRITSKSIELHGEARVTDIVKNAELLCSEKDVIFFLNSPEEITINHPNNIHLNSKKLLSCTHRPRCQKLSASCHNAEELSKASEIGVDFVFLSPVQVTASHPDALLLGWEKFSVLLQDVNIPVYALGGVGENDLTDAWNAGAQGVAGIGCFWK